MPSRLVLRLTETYIDDTGQPLGPSTIHEWPHAGGWPSRAAWMARCRERVTAGHHRDRLTLLPQGYRTDWPGVVIRDVELVER